jgi:hypothetical protein
VRTRCTHAPRTTTCPRCCAAASHRAGSVRGVAPSAGRTHHTQHVSGALHTHAHACAHDARMQYAPRRVHGAVQLHHTARAACVASRHRLVAPTTRST